MHSSTLTSSFLFSHSHKGYVNKKNGRVAKLHEFTNYICCADMREERNWLAAKAYPQIKEFCNDELDMDFQVVDMRWGVSDDATNEHITEDLCLSEIAKCQRASFGPNFVVMSWLNYSCPGVMLCIS